VVGVEQQDVLVRGQPQQPAPERRGSGEPERPAGPLRDRRLGPVPAQLRRFPGQVEDRQRLPGRRADELHGSAVHGAEPGAQALVPVHQPGQRGPQGGLVEVTV